MSYYRFTILLSASVPSERRSKKYEENYIKIKNAQIQIEEAIIGLSRNIFQANGKIVFGGHPSISPLVAMIATEFRINMEIENISRNEGKEKPITIFQSRAYEKVIPNETINLFTLGYTNIVWTDAVSGEEFNPNIQGELQCEKSLELMRDKMINEQIDALVCIGGMEGVEREFEMFREYHPRKPVFLLKSTGGATKILADNYSNSDNIRIIDNIDYVRPVKEQIGEEVSEKFNIIPYSFITAMIVRDVISENNR
ncbi:hypothetical protein [Telluribacter sp. SYSU D00476]|uniref:SLOG domain-containing protein n=1 Tax=Telluribacter sp. SYSU D00476 TaxID=2811430 RepID=UPI001FF608CB|nr:hypothetical protein [Telluribacter sp. SYSU D00476]